ncbi:TetR/AcrR family transcriptional regulator [Flavicella sediminum]|uniref:TetR/AcrR family transcriptional regulator n=1 Tax=Flavicella sediminum TaxID=2585141 RepID=UPI0011200B9B|nr:TetR/AcrR family transcriptional regulator [Flavicella sediminum]
MKCKILETAGEMFLSFGFKSVTMDDIAQKMSISKKTIYTHFSNKRILIEETTFGLFQFIKCGIDDIREKNYNPIEELYEIKNFILKHLKDETSSPQYQLNKYYPKIHATLMKKQFTVMQECVADNLQKGIDQGLFRKEIDVDFITRIYFKGMTGIKDLDTFPLDTFSMNYLMENYIDYHVRGIATEKGIQTLEQLKTSI